MSALSNYSIQSPVLNRNTETVPLSPVLLNKNQKWRDSHPIMIALNLIASLVLIYAGIAAIGTCAIFFPVMAPLAVFAGFSLIAVGNYFFEAANTGAWTWGEERRERTKKLSN